MCKNVDITIEDNNVVKMLILQLKIIMCKNVDITIEDNNV